MATKIIESVERVLDKVSDLTGLRAVVSASRSEYDDGHIVGFGSALRIRLINPDWKVVSITRL